MIRQKYNFSEKSCPSCRRKGRQLGQPRQLFCIFATQNVEVMDFFGFMVINCSCDDVSRSFYHHLFWSSDDAYYIEGPIRYGKKGMPMVEISLMDSASDTILITVGSLHSLEIIDTIPSEKLDTIRLVKRR